MLRYSVVAFLLGACVAACGADTTSTDDPTLSKVQAAPVFGKTDAAFGILETGRFGASGTASGTIDGESALSYRFNAFGNTKVRIALSSPGLEMDSYVVVDGPIPGGEGKIVARNDDDPSQDTLDSFVEVTLEQPGAYRILVGSYGTFQQEPGDGGAFELSYECLESCAPPVITLSQLIQGLQAELGPEQAAELLQASIASLFSDPETAAAVGAQLAGLLASPQGVEIFPTVPLNLTDTAQGFFESEETPVPAPAAVHFSVEEILTQGCSATRSKLEPVDERIPGLTTGSYADYTLDDCSLQRAQAFAEVLNNLALDNGSTVTHEGETFGSLEAVVNALILAGHRIVITNDRFFADFLGLWYKGAAVAAPVWLETTIPLADGAGNLALPSPHTHHTIEVTGPLVNARVMFYMGVSAGTSFRANSNLRAPWTGLRTLHTYDSAEDPEKVLKIFVMAGHLRKLWTEQAQGLPAGGYGTLGVCNDSTAIIEFEVENGDVTIFPLGHPRLTDVPADDPGGVQGILAALPTDVEGYESTEALERILLSLPAQNLDDLAFPQFVEQLRALAE